MKRLLTIIAAKNEYVSLIMDVGGEKKAKRLKEAFKRAEKAGLDSFWFSDEVIKEEAGLQLSTFAQRAIIAHDVEFLGAGRTVQWVRAYFVRGLGGSFGPCDMATFKSALYRGEDTRKGFKFTVLEDGKPVFNPVYMVRSENSSSKDGSPWFSLSFLRRTGEKLGVVPCFGRMSDSALKLWAGEPVKPEYIAPIIVDNNNDLARPAMVAAMVSSGRIPIEMPYEQQWRMWYRLAYKDAVSERVSADLAEENDVDTREPKNKQYSSVFIGVIVILAAFYAEYEIGITRGSDLPRVQLENPGEFRTRQMLKMLSDNNGERYATRLVATMRRMGHGAGAAYRDLLAREYWIVDRERERGGTDGTDEWIAYCIMVRSGLDYMRRRFEIE